MNDPILSVVIPTYNNSLLLPKTIESVLNSNFKRLEIIVIDDGSTDNTKKVVKKYPEVVYHHQQNMGLKSVAYPYNSGIKLARGRFIHCLDNDDLVYPHTYDVVLDLFQNKNVGMVCSNAVFIDIDGNITGPFTSPKFSETDFLLKSFIQNLIIAPSVILRRECYDKVGLFDPENGPFVDYEHWIKVFRYFKIAHIDQPLVQYRKHHGQHSQKPESVKHLDKTLCKGRRRIIRDYSLAEIVPDKSPEESLKILYKAMVVCKEEHLLDDLFKKKENNPLQSKTFYYMDAGNRLAARNEQTDAFTFINNGMDSIITRDGSSNGKKAHSKPVSVIITTFNRPDLLVQAIRSVQGQTYKNTEIIVVNGGGIDVSNVIKCVDSKGNIKYINHEQNIGLAESRNSGLKVAQGEYVFYLDDDDLIYPNHIQILTLCLNENHRVAYTDYVRSFQELINGEYVTIMRQEEKCPEFDRDRFLVENYIPVMCVMHDRSLVNSCGMFDSKQDVIDDWDFWTRLSRKNDFYHIPVPSCEYRIRIGEKNMLTAVDKETHLRRIKNIYEKYHNFTFNRPDIVEKQKSFLKRVDPRKCLKTATSAPNADKFMEMLKT